MVISRKRYIEENVVANLIECTEVCAANGDAEKTIKTAKYLMKIAKKLDDEIVNIRPEDSKAYAETPPEN